MVPPPDNTGDEFPDFEKMSFEEQMAWLESLAKRQGAGADELTTAADLDIPVPENAEVDEPGYVPFEGSRSAREMQAMAKIPSPEPEEPAAPPVDVGMPAEEIPDEVAEDVIQMAGVPSSVSADEDDPMRWLDSLAVQPTDREEEAASVADHFDLDAETELEVFADSEEFLVAEAEDAFGEPDDVTDTDELIAQAELADVDSFEEMPAASSDDLLGGMDPMLWLESLAARQGANVSELTTSADLEIEDVPEGAAIDEPGYVPFEGSRSAREAAAMAARVEDQVEAEAEGELPDLLDEVEEAEADLDLADIFDITGAEELEAEVDDELFDLFAEEEEPETDFAMADVFGAADEFDSVDEDAGLEHVVDGIESMEWLESLAKRQGARDEELLTSADIDVPEMPADTVIDEPGYVEYSPLSILPGDQSYDTIEEADELAGIAEFEDDTSDGGLSWLEDLAAEPDEDVAEFLAFEDDVVARYADEVEPIVPAEAVAESVDPLAGMSDEDVARAQAQGTLTPHQELAWLKRQARALAETREAEELAAHDQEIPPAEPAEIPDWLETIRQTSEQEVKALADDVLDDSAVDSGVLPDWLHEPDEVALGGEAGFVEVSLDGDVESLWGDDIAEREIPDLDQLIPDSELAAFVSGDFSADEPDTLAEALDEEYERLQDGDDSEPEWYTAAVAKVEAEASDLEEFDAEQFVLDDDVEPEEPVVLAAAEPVDAPGWLDDIAAEEDVPEAVMEDVDSDMPDWLRDVDAVSASSSDTLPDWLADEAEGQPEAEIMPHWLTGIDEDVVAPEPELELEAKHAVEVIESEPEVPAPPSLPEDAVFARFRQRLESDPKDHPSRLGLARALRTNRIVDSALDQYEVLIEAAEMLPDVSNDLIAIVDEAPEKPRTQRLLGDAYMRQGMLSEALEAYRNALHQL